MVHATEAQRRPPEAVPDRQRDEEREHSDREPEEEARARPYHPGLGNRAVERMAAAEAAAPAEERVPETQAPASQTDAEAESDAESGSITFADAEEEVDLGLPEPSAAVPDVVEEVRPMALEGSSEEALGSFSGASASEVAATYPGLGGTISGKLESEQAEEAANAPVLVARTDGTEDAAVEDPERVELPDGVPGGALPVGNDPGEAEATPHVEGEPTPDNSESRRLLEGDGGGGGFLSWFKDRFRSFFSGIRTNDPGVNTSAGPTPSVPLQGESNPSRANDEKARAASTVTEGRDTLSQSIAEHPGQSNIQPRHVNEPKPVVLNTALTNRVETAEDSGMADYLAVELPKEVRGHADELMQPALEKGLNELDKKAKEASTKKETDKQTEITKANTQAKTLSENAAKEQKGIVTARRKEVADEQKKGIGKAYAGVSEFNTKAKAEQKKTQESIDEKVETAEGDAQKEIDKGESEAEDIKEKKEAEAAEKKKKLDEEQESKSWWDRAVDAIKSAVKALTEAIDSIFNALRELVKKAIEAAKQLAVDLINAARKWVIEKLEAFRTWAKEMVDTYVKEYFPNVAKAMNAAIDTVVDGAVTAVNAVADTMIAGVEALASALTAALDKILSVFQTALKAAVQIAGAILTGDFAEALKIAIRAACDIAGIDSAPIFDFFDRAGKQIMAILKAPGKFFGNLVEAVGNGVRNFVKNIKKHLINGLLGWLTGALSEVAITLPEKFDFKGMLSLVMQILGLTYANVKARIIKKVPGSEKVFDLVEKGLEVIKEIAVHGPIVLWKKIKESLGNLKEMVLTSIREFVIFTVIKEGITWLLGLLNPAAAIVKIIKLLFDLVMFLIQRFNQIKDFVLSVYGSIAAIASGNLASATQAVEGALARSLPVAISLLASLAGLGGIGKTVQKIITKVSSPVNFVIDKIVDTAVKYARKLLGGKKQGKGAEKKAAGKGSASLDTVPGETVTFNAGGEGHRLWITPRGNSVEVMVASDDPGPVDKKLAAWKKRLPKLQKPTRDTARAHIAKAETLSKGTQREGAEEQRLIKEVLKDREVTPAESARADRAEEDTLKQEKALKTELAALFGIFGFDAEDLETLYEAQIKASHPKAQAGIRAAIAKKAQSGLKVDSWEALKQALLAPKSLPTSAMVTQPLSTETPFGQAMYGFAVTTLKKVAEGEREKAKWEAFKNGDNDTKAARKFIDARIAVVHGKRSDQAKALCEAMQLLVYDKSKNPQVVTAMRTYLQESLAGNGAAEHTRYQPVIPDGGIRMHGGKFMVDYGYADETGAKKHFTVTFDFNSVSDKQEVVQSTRGTNLALKDPGSRGKTASSGELKTFDNPKKLTGDAYMRMLREELLKRFIRDRKGAEALATALRSAKPLEESLTNAEKPEFESYYATESARYASYAKDDGPMKLDSAHVVADWFGGSGYKQALNLSVTSAEYNRVVMGGAEKSIVKTVERKDAASLFDLTVTARWDYLRDNEIIATVNKTAISRQLNVAEGQARDELAKDAEAELSRVLASKQDPRRVLGVDYAGSITQPGTAPLNETIGCDVWMSNAFDFDKKKQCVI